MSSATPEQQTMQTEQDQVVLEAPPQEEEAQPIAVSKQPKAPPVLAQMVCGSCRSLLTYPPGAKHVQCSCCQTVNFVLEAHQVGQVKCDSCTTLLMYPYGAPAVRCSSCSFVTEVRVSEPYSPGRYCQYLGHIDYHCRNAFDHNMRPPWSVQQGQPTNSVS